LFGSCTPFLSPHPSRFCRTCSYVSCARNLIESNGIVSPGWSFPKLVRESGISQHLSMIFNP
jgi:hypothetical protein